MMKALTEREKILIRKGLHMLESALYADELHYEYWSEFEETPEGVPSPKEVRTLMDKMK